ncbi:hypothetical protein WDV91_09310 [Curtobacterium flaccumfaciens pv. flaccumfaciens]
MRIAIYAFDGITMFHLSVPQMVFDEVTRLGLADWETVVFSDRHGSVRTAEGLTLGPVQGLDATADADLVVVPSWTDDGTRLPAPTERAVVNAHARGIGRGRSVPRVDRGRRCRAPRGTQRRHALARGRPARRRTPRRHRGRRRALRRPR